ncbi:hypothetical protein K439DRAFT_1416900 [Ramaria rubella]|nr:hypothetical protein K439DRAFT_1416900 [Ramaria rubella]
MRIFHSPSPPPTCFFCLTPLVNNPRNPKSFKCPYCSCWNRYDETGEIVSDEPAMREESLNAASFAKRASPSKHRLPTKYGKAPFCHTCLTNQTLLMNLLSNYLPPPDDPTYEDREAELPAYKASLQTRYPPVCNDCQPSVDEDLRKKEHMARTTALGGWLKRSQHVGTQRSIELQRGVREALLWKGRGAMWIATLMLFMLVDLSGMLRYHLNRRWLAFSLPMLVTLSLLWTFWDPTWSTVRASRLQGRSFSVSGRKRYIRCQMIIWLSRLITSCLIGLHWSDMIPTYVTSYCSRWWYTTAFATEVVLAIFSLIGLRIQRPPTVRLLEPRNLSRENSRDSSTPIPELKPDTLFSNLSLASHIPSTAVNPIFGQPSFPAPAPDIPEEDMMDWTPTNPQERVQDREGWMRPQRFFPPEQPTGLEDLFEMAKLDAEERTENQNQQQHEQPEQRNPEMRELALFFGAAVAIALMAGLCVYRF